MTPTQPQHFSSQASVHPNARIHPTAVIDPFAIIHDDVEVGAYSHIGSHVVLYSGVKVGEKCRLMPNVVVSAEVKNLEYWREEEDIALDGVSAVLIGDNVHIESGAVIHGSITIGNNTWIGSHVTIHDGARIGESCRIFPGAVLSAIPQDLKFHGEKTTLEIGDHTTVREFATLNRGTDYYGKTVIGKHCLIMAYVHIAHDCILGDHVIIVNSVNMAGHVEIGDYGFIGGTSAVHQFVKIGTHAFVSGGSMVRKDVPPYVKAGRDPVQYEGVNSIGLRRRGFANEVIHQIQDIYREIFLSGKNNTKALDYVEAHLPATEERDEIITFIRGATRGIIKGHTGSSKAPTSPQ